MTARPTLRELRRELLDGCLELDVWLTPSDCQYRLGLPGADWYRVALLLERLTNDGIVELQRPGTTRRRFRLRRRAA